MKKLTKIERSQRGYKLGQFRRRIGLDGSQLTVAERRKSVRFLPMFLLYGLRERIHGEDY